MSAHTLPWNTGSTSRATFAARPGLTLFLGLTLAAWAVSSAFAVLLDGRALWFHVVTSAPALYFLCICIHDGVHGVLVRHRGVNQGAAFLLSLVIALPFPLLQASHLRHHRRVGNDDDPERVVYGVSFWKLFARLPFIPLFYLRSVSDLSRGAKIGFALHVFLVASFFAIAASKFGVSAVLFAWVLPTALAVGWFGLTTVYIPHCAHATTWMRVFNTHSGWHFDHHRDPRFPFSQYAQLRAFHLQTDVFESSRLERAVLTMLARPMWSTKRS